MTLNQAKAKYPHRFTMEHVPAWAKQIRSDGTYYAPQYATDAEWFERTIFFDETRPQARQLATPRHCHSQCPTWPLGQALREPYNLNAPRWYWETIGYIKPNQEAAPHG